MATSVIKPSNAGIDLPIDLPTTGWSSNQWTYINGAITDNCVVEVEFKAGTLNDNVPYIEYEKVSGGITFTVPVIPTVAIPVVAHVYFTNNNSITIADAVNINTSQTVSQTLGANVDTALTSLNNKIENQDLYLDEIQFCMYNGHKLYRRLFAATLTNVASNTDILVPSSSWSATLPAYNKIACGSVSFYINGSFFEADSRYVRVYLDNSGIVHLNQVIGSGVTSILIKLDLYYIKD